MTDWRELGQRTLLVAAAVAAVAGARVLGLAAMRESSELPVKVVTSPVQLSEPPKPLRAQDFMNAALANAQQQPDLSALNGGEPARHEPQMITALISVITNGARREVWLKDVHLGHSPYVGQLDCEKGSSLDFTLRQKDGRELKISRPCRAEIRITESD